MSENLSNENQIQADQPRQITSAQWSVVALIVACAAGSILYKILTHSPFEHSAAMFLGIPAILAIVLALTPRAKSVTGGICKGITLALLIVAPLLGEGYLCILMASPLFYLVGIGVGLIADLAERSRKRNAGLSCVALVLLPMCLEGIVPALTWSRAQTVEVTSIVDAPAALVEQALAQSPRLETPLPATLRIGYPRPLEATGGGLTPGASRTIHFSGAEGDPPGDLTMRVAEHRDGYTRFETISDTSKLTQWIAWNSSEVQWQPIDPAHTRVTWSIHYRRQVDPAWYFAPWERFVARQAAAWLIDANAVPAAHPEEGSAF